MYMHHSYPLHQAYVLGNNLYLYSVATGELVTITTDGAKNLIYNGIPDWVYEGKGARVGGREGGS